MEFDTKRVDDLARLAVQNGNKSWWTTQTMSYDWKDKIKIEKFSRAWFDQSDERFLKGAELLSDAKNPFVEMIDIPALEGRKVLEIGCGMGFHAEMIAQSGARYTGIDISETSVEATRKRFAIKNLAGDVIQMDAEKLEFPDNSFDMVWSWGVIHHSSRTGRIVREIERVLKPGGVAKIMVYNSGGMAAYHTMMTKYAVKFWLGKSLDEVLWASSDGYTARFYTKDLFADQLQTFFDTAKVTVLGQEADAIPLPGRIRKYVTPMFSIKAKRALARKRGSFLYATAAKS